MPSILRKNLARDYALTLSWRYAEVEFLGLPNLKDERVFRLEHIYVPLRLCSDWTDRFDRQKSVYVPRALQEKRHLTVLGDPGGGKSTLVKVLTYAFGEADTNAYKRACGELIPIPIILRDYQIRHWQNYTDMLRDFIATLDEDIRGEVTPEWLLEHLSEGKAILLIDGLDEVGLREERLRLRDEIILPLLSTSHRSYSLLTSRIVGYEEVPFDFEFLAVSKQGQALKPTAIFFPSPYQSPRRFYVSPFDDEEIAQFITRWYQLRESSPGKQREGVESLMRALSQNDRVKQLAHNPQLLTLMALIHRVTANLPSGRVELYDKIVEAYLETIQVYRKLGTPAKLDEMKRWLAKVGWEMQSQRDGTGELWSNADALQVSPDEIKRWLVEAMAKGRGEDEAPELAERFLDYVAKRSGLLVPLGPEKFAFAHLTFQEYFAAFELRGRVRRFDKLAETCAELAARRYWHETLNLLFEMLNEFPGACDDLLDEIATRTEADAKMRGGAAKLFSSILLDEQSGLSDAKQREAAAFALAAVCDRYDEGVLKDLQALQSERDDQLVRPWFAHRLQERTAGKFFFTNGAELMGDWPAQLSRWVAGPAYRRPDDLQVAEIALIGAADEEAYQQIFPWAVGNIPLNLWLRRISHSFGDEGGLTLADLYRLALYSSPATTPRDLLLLESSIALAITKSQVIRLVSAIIDNALTYKDSLYYRNPDYKERLFARHLVDWHDGVLNGVLRKAATGASARVLPRDLARVFALDLAADGSGSVARMLAHALALEATATEQPFPGSANSNALLRVLIAAERALFAPDTPTVDLTAGLHSLQCEKDDWSRLLAGSALLMMGEGSPELCRERNALLDKGLAGSARFTFPARLRAETHKEEFRRQLPELFDLIFLQAPGSHWLRPEFFDPAGSASQFFLSPPRRFFALAARVLDPNGETELARWR
jgi:hypothetical protein